jgi:hypothetical protein
MGQTWKRLLFAHWLLPAAAVRPLVPPGLELDTWNGNAFAAVALVEVERIRPAGAPRRLGIDAFMAGYRIFVRHGTSLRGLRIVRSETDSRALALLGNVFTRYGWSHVPVAVSDDGDAFAVRTPTLELEADLRPAGLPDGSPFADLDEARRFAGPMPYTFEHEPETGALVVVRGVRGAWNPQPVSVRVARCDFCAGGTLANAFHVAGVDYRWNRGSTIPTRTR